MLIGNYVRLRRIEAQDAEYVRGLRNSPHVVRNYQDRFPISDFEQRDFLQSLTGCKDRILFIAELFEPFERVGVFSIQNIDYRNQRAETGVMLDEMRMNSGVPLFEGAFLLLDFAFGYLNMNKITGEVLADNQRAIRLNEGIGMQVEGVRKKHVFYSGDFHDVILFSLFRDDFYNRPTRAVKQFQERKEPGRSRNV